MKSPASKRAFFCMSIKTHHFHAHNPADLHRAAELLKGGGIGAIPTETVYGLAGDATNALAVQKIFEAKARPYSDPLIVHVASVSKALTLGFFHDEARMIAESFWPGPLTLVVSKQTVIPDTVTAGRDTVALRIPMHALTRNLLENGDLALAAPSANAFGKLSPTEPDHVKSQLEGNIDFILDDGPTGWGLESTILDVSRPEKWLHYRPGPVIFSDIEAWMRAHTPQIELQDLSRNVSSSSSESLPAPGLLSRHYSPNTPLHLCDSADIPDILAAWEPETINALVVTGLTPHPNVSNHPRVFQCSADGSMDSAGHRLYGLLHQLDAMDFNSILVERFPDRGLGKVINNRLERASSS